ncbi:MAG: long-chain acyl-CoA [Geobacteraceae bacterium]|nr:MAG: long-chain acyl-CoA [Geobacteraceae bacterium]
MKRETDIIDPKTAGTLAGLLRERVRRSPQAPAYLRFAEEENRWEEISWEEVAKRAALWQGAFRKENLRSGDRVAVMLRNSLEWVLFDLAATGLGLVTVPLFVNDRPENFASILEETGARLLLIEGVEQWERIERVSKRLVGIRRIVTLQPVCEKDCDPRLCEVGKWLPKHGDEFAVRNCEPEELATVVYTSGTTGNPKGVMLSHANILENAHAGLKLVTVYPDDLFLSFLPLSHTLERTVGFYVPMMTGACVAHVRSIEKLAEDLVAVRPTVLVAVPRIFERVHRKIMEELDEKPPLARKLFFLTVAVGWMRFKHLQGRAGWAPLLPLWPLLRRAVASRVTARLGGRLRFAISGGAPLSPSVARVFIGLGVNILQGYGLTETSPVISVNTIEDNMPATVGLPFPGVEVKTAADEELLVRGPNVMLGYWRNEEATKAVIDDDGWLHTGDMARIDAKGHIRITGRIKEIIVLSTGEKVPPEDIEVAIVQNHLIEQALVVGEGRPYLGAIVVLNERQWVKLAARLGIDPDDSNMLDNEKVQRAVLERIAVRLKRFPGYAQVRRVFVTLSPWSVQEGLITATLKLRRKALLARFAGKVESLYTGH